MKAVTSLSGRPSSCAVLKAPPPYSSCVSAQTTVLYGAERQATHTGGYAASNGAGPPDDDDVKSRRRSRAGGASRTPASAPPTFAAKSRRYKRPSENASRRQHQSYAVGVGQIGAAHRQLPVATSDCHAWTYVDPAAAYPTHPVADYGTSSGEVTSCRYQPLAGAVRPPYRHDLLAVVPSIGPGETGPAAERLKQMAAHYQRLAAEGASGDGTGAPGCYDERYSYELYDEYAVQCQRLAIQSQHQHPAQSVYYDPIGYTQCYLGPPTCNGLRSTDSSGHAAQYAVPEPEVISACHVTPPQYSYNGATASYSAAPADCSVSYEQNMTTTSTTALRQAGTSYSGGMTTGSAENHLTTFASASGNTSMCFSAAPASAEPRRSAAVDSFVECYPESQLPPPPAASSSLSQPTAGTTTTSARLPSRLADFIPVPTPSTLHSPPVEAPLAGRSPWALGLAGAVGGGGTSTWLSGITSPDIATDAASLSYCQSTRLDNGGSAKPAVVRSELFTHRQASLAGEIELY